MKRNIITFEECSFYTARLVKALNRTCFCTNCGGVDYDEECVCIGCGRTNSKYLRYYQKLDELFKYVNFKMKVTRKPLDIFDYPGFLGLYNFHDIPLESLEKFLNKCKLVDRVDNKIKEILRSDSLSDENRVILSDLIKHDALGKRAYEVSNYVIALLLHGDRSFDKEIAKKAFRIFADEIIESMGDEIKKCYFVDKVNKNQLVDMAVGETSATAVYLKNALFDDFYENESIDIFEVLFHELGHVYQDVRERKLRAINTMGIDSSLIGEEVIKILGNETLTVLKQQEEDIIRIAFDSKYYVENYEYIDSEIEANLFSYNQCVKFFKKWGFLYSDEKCDWIAMRQNEIRSLDGEKSSYHDLFLMAINKLDAEAMFKYYPALNLRYKLEDGVVLAKNNNELGGDFLSFLVSINNTYEQKDNAKNIYRELMDDKRQDVMIRKR